MNICSFQQHALILAIKTYTLVYTTTFVSKVVLNRHKSNTVELVHLRAGTNREIQSKWIKSCLVSHMVLISEGDQCDIAQQMYLD